MQKIGCYESDSNANACKTTYNCAPDTDTYRCSGSGASDGSSGQSCPSVTNAYGEVVPVKRQQCYGPDANYCSGILKKCTTNDGYYCNSSVINPTVNTMGDNIGCDVVNDPDCMEFENSLKCQTDCWELGGRKEIQELCSKLDQNHCTAQKYFCKWSYGVCNAVKDDPWLQFNANSPKDTLGNPMKVFTENVSGAGGLSTSCAQSSWSDTSVTSYADTIRTCCVTDANGQKSCITTPRCQFVEKISECGFKDIDSKKNPSYNAIGPSGPTVKKPHYICSDIQTTVTTGTTGTTGPSGSNTYTETGYCTWCKGTQLKNFDYYNWAVDNMTQGSDIAWSRDESYTGRCSNYNQCEVGESEKLWNDCVYRNSDGKYGAPLDPMGPPGSESTQSPSGTQSPQGPKDFCYISDTAQCLNVYTAAECLEMSRLKNVCETELAKTVSTKNQLVVNTVNGLYPSVPRCTEGTSWTHMCIKGPNGLNAASNYACGWCANLQNNWPENPCPVSMDVHSLSNLWYSSFAQMGYSEPQAIGISIAIFILCALFIICIGVIIAYAAGAIGTVGTVRTKAP